MNPRSIAAATSSQSVEWATPWDLYHQLNDLYGRDEWSPNGCDLDVCATPENAKCDQFFTPEQDGLRQSWAGHVCWMNPEYGRKITPWLAKAFRDSQTGSTKVVSLLPARTDTRWWHEFVEPVRLGAVAGHVDFLRGRVRFQGAKYPALFPSVCVVFGGRGQAWV